MSYARHWWILSIVLLLLLWADLCLGQLQLSAWAPFEALWQPDAHDTLHYIALHYRWPKMLMALGVGVGISLSGLYMQTLFRNPLAGPYILGITSGSSLLIAVAMMGAAALPLTMQEFAHLPWVLTLLSFVGSALSLAVVLGLSRRMRDNTAILLIGFMFSSLCAAWITLLTYFSKADDLQRYTLWGLGQLGAFAEGGLRWVWIANAIGLGVGWRWAKAMDVWTLGDTYAQSMGVSTLRLQRFLMLATGLMSGTITAFVGPIAFVGMAVPIAVKHLFHSPQHRVLLTATTLCGAIAMVACDLLSQCPGLDFTLPINAVTSSIGAPFVIWVIYRRQVGS